MVLWIAPAAGAVTIEPFSIYEFVGRDAEVEIQLEQTEIDGEATILITATVIEGRGHLRGLYFDVSDDFDASQLDVKVYDFDNSGAVINVAPGANLRGGGPPQTFDFGVELGPPGRSDGFETLVLAITSETLDIDLAMLSEQLFGARLAAPSGKLRGESPFIVPEPSTAGLVAAGLISLAIAGRRRSLVRP
jgi:hypothetical protein